MLISGFCQAVSRGQLRPVIGVPLEFVPRSPWPTGQASSARTR